LVITKTHPITFGSFLAVHDVHSKRPGNDKRSVIKLVIDSRMFFPSTPVSNRSIVNENEIKRHSTKMARCIIAKIIVWVIVVLFLHITTEFSGRGASPPSAATIG
jgi:hypothetical protein